MTVVFVFLNILFLISNYSHFDFDQQLGYLDPQLFWQSLGDFSQGKIIYKDLYWEYGFLYLVIGWLPFVWLGKTFFASVLIRLFLFPLIAISISFLIGRQLLKKWWLLLFLFLLFIYGTANDFTSLRHLLPELGLILLVLGIENNFPKKSLLGSGLLGLSLISSPEYGLAAIAASLVYFTIFLIRNPNQLGLRKILTLITPIVLVAGPYFVFLQINQALSNLLAFYSQYATSFYYNSPCRELFPRLANMTPEKASLYLVPLLLIALAAWSVIKKRLALLPLLLYSLLIYSRILSTPCATYLNYGLTFLFLIVVLIISEPDSSRRLKVATGLIVGWFLIIGSASLLKILPNKLETDNGKRFLPIAGVELKSEVAKEYQEILEFIEKNSQESDYLYVYPNGPYNQLARRRSPVSISSSWYYDLVPSLVQVTIGQLRQREPKLVVINTSNAWSLKSALNQVPYNLYSDNDNLIFEGITTPVEDFISQNYKIAKKFKLAWVLEKRESPLETKKLYLPLAENPQFKITTQNLSQSATAGKKDILAFELTSKNPAIQIDSNAFKNADLVKISLKVDLGFAKPVSKYVINVLATKGGQYYVLNRQLATSDWQEIWVFLSKDKTENGTEVIIAVSDNQGFVWWGKPKSIRLGLPAVLIRNPNLHIDGHAF